MVQSLGFFEDGGYRPALLMCAPRLYEVEYVINPWMEGNVHTSSRLRAMEQWQRLHAALERIATVVLIEPELGSPDMVFTANAGLARDGVVALSSFAHPERQGEEVHFRRWFQRAGYAVVDIARETPFEGEGDALFSADGKTLWVGYGTRTRVESHSVLRSLWASTVLSLHLVDPRFYHLDTCFAPLPNGDVLYYPAAFDAESLQRIEDVYPAQKRIAVREDDAMRFACNVVALGRTLVLNRVSGELARELRGRGFDVVEVELDEFMKAGGAAKCLTMFLTPGLHARVEQQAVTTELTEVAA